MTNTHPMVRLIALVLLLILLPQVVWGESGSTVLSLGSQGPQVVDLQQKLQAAGFLSSPADGKYGQGTSQAVLALQLALIEKGHAIKADGVAGPQTLALLSDQEAMRPFVDFGVGTTGSRVIALQTRLIDLKFLSGNIDGAFGQQTLDALLAFQRHLMSRQIPGITQSGKADEATREWLDPQKDLTRLGIKAPEFFDESKPLELSDEFLNAKAAILVNARDGKILYAKNPDLRLYPASTTKMMTLLLAVENGNLDQSVVLPPCTSQIPKDSSLVPVYPGETMPMKDLLHGLMIRSGNDAANAVAELIAGSQEAFADRMNQRAAQMGLKNTHFTNPHGYHHQDHYSTVRDLASISLYLMSNSQAAAIASTVEYTMEATRKRGPLHIVNSNELLNPLSPYFYKGAFGIKSGYTSYAGFCYAGMAQRDGQVLLAVIMGSRTRNRGWNDMKHLFNYGFERLKK